MPTFAQCLGQSGFRAASSWVGHSNADAILPQAHLFSADKEGAGARVGRLHCRSIGSAGPRLDGQGQEGFRHRPPQVDDPAFRIGKGGHFCRQGVSVGRVRLELTTAVFAQGNLGLEFPKVHCPIPFRGSNMNVI